MKPRLIACLAVLAACGTPANPAAPPPANVAIPASPAALDDAFRADVRAFAAARGRKLAVWGTLRLGGTAVRHRFAMLDVLVGEDGREPGSAHDGAYVLEEAPDRYFMVTYWWNAYGFRHPEEPPAGEPRWEVLDDVEIEHQQMHNHGKARIAFGFRDGDLVALRDEDYHSRVEPEMVHHVYTDATGACAHRCPKLAGLNTRGAQLVVSGPARTIAALVEPPPQY